MDKVENTGLELPNMLHQLAEKSNKSMWKVILCILVIGLILTGIVINRVQNDRHQNNTLDIDRRIDDAMSHLDATLVTHGNLLVSLQGMFQASGTVGRKEYHDFIESIDIPGRYPSVSGLSWNQAVKYDLRGQFETSVRQDQSLLEGGHPEFAIKPPMEPGQPGYVVTYIEPMQGNEKAFGFDIGSNASRRMAVERARDTGMSVATAPINLVQQSKTQKGFLLIMPVYDEHGAKTVGERRSAFAGVVVAVFRLPVLIGDSVSQKFDSVVIKDITDASADNDARWIYASEDAPEQSLLYTSQRQLEIGGRTWQLEFGVSQSVVQPGITMTEISLGLFGLIASLLSPFIYWLLCQTKTRAIKHANELTHDLQTANADLDRSNKDLNQFAYIASHDLQTPVRSIRMGVELLECELGSEVGDDVKNYLTHLRDSADRLKHLLSDLLTYAQANRREMQLADVPLDVMTRRVAGQLQAQYDLPDDAIKIHASLADVWGDKTQVERLVTNLIGNAIKYRNPDRSIEITVSTEKSANDCTLSVADNGIGIEEENHLKVFEPFKRLHRHEEIEGTGLGLGICHQIMALHSGSIHVAKSSNQGTTFSAQFPGEYAIKVAA